MRVPRSAVLVTAGVVSTALLGLTGAGTLSSLSARITSDPDTLALGSLVLQLTSDGQTCRSTDGGSGANNIATCTTVQPLTGRADLLPNGTYVKTITAANTGTTAASSFTLVPGACTPIGTVSGSTTAAAKSDICNRVKVVVDGGSGPSTAFTAAQLGAQSFSLAIPPKNGGTTTVTITSTIDDLDNAYQGLGVSVPMTWTLQQ